MPSTRTPNTGHATPARRGPDLRLHQLASEDGNAAVSAVHLPQGMALIARDERGAVRAVEVVDPDGRTMLGPDAIRALGSARAQAERVVEQTTAAAAALVALQIAAAGDDDVNMAAIARDLGVSRTTLYSRVEGADVAPPTPPATNAKRKR